MVSNSINRYMFTLSCFVAMWHTLTLIYAGFFGGVYSWGALSAPPEKIDHISRTTKVSLTKFSDIINLAIPLVLNLFGPRSHAYVSHTRNRKAGTSRQKIWDPKKSKFQNHPREKFFLWKVVFLQINLALATQKCNKINLRGQNRAKT